MSADAQQAAAYISRAAADATEAAGNLGRHVSPALEGWVAARAMSASLLTQLVADGRLPAGPVVLECIDMLGGSTAALREAEQ